MIKLLEETRDFGEGRKATVVLSFIDTGPGWKPILLALAKRWNADGRTTPWCADGAALASLPEGALPATSVTMASAVERIEDMFREIQKSVPAAVQQHRLESMRKITDPVGPHDSLHLNVASTCSRCGNLGAHTIGWVTVYLIGSNTMGAMFHIPPGWRHQPLDDGTEGVCYQDVHCQHCGNEQRMWLTPTDAREKLQQAMIRRFISTDMLLPHAHALVQQRGLKSGRHYHLTIPNAAGILRMSTEDLARQLPSDSKVKSTYLSRDPEAVAVRGKVGRWTVRFRLPETQLKKGRGK